ncbi:hypothetical protein BT63DRAFT_476384 [Microthyrium microscopicum]|uniref:MICOS complex subunit MIC12 n=1 Tax=Microthyrium microscopicum TaxID=703497 RepID=A0A6A6US91_9PEZI|nr:hypothetical protein BT63DRAFT_476384 [Microthyrium microscopicum]
MGFVNGFLGGVTLTSSILYLTITIHRQNRIQQAALLRQQDTVLRSLIEPNPPAPLPRAREVQAGLVEQGKDAWNAEIEAIVRRVNNTDWNAVRANLEGRIRRLAGKAAQKVEESKVAERVANATGLAVDKATSRREG